MSCIVGISAAGGVYIGADSAGVDGSRCIQLRSDPKIFSKNIGLHAVEFVYGVIGSYRIAQTIRQVGFEPSNDLSRTYIGTERYMFHDWLPAFKDAVICADAVKDDKGIAHLENNARILVGVRDKLYCVMEDFQIGQYEDDYTAIGAGTDFALGALHGLTSSIVSLTADEERDTYEEMVRTALGAAAYFSPFVREPFIVLHT